MGSFNICDVFDHFWLLGRKRAEAVKVMVWVIIVLFPPLGVYIARQAVQRAQSSAIATSQIFLKAWMSNLNHLSVPPTKPLPIVSPAAVADPRLPAPVYLTYPNKH